MMRKLIYLWAAIALLGVVAIAVTGPRSLEQRLQFAPGAFPPGIEYRYEGLRQLRPKTL
jgi:hypothetical protein